MLDFTNRDYESIRSSLIDYVSTNFQWNDTNESDPVMIYINTLAGISAMLNFYIDKQSNECFINLAQEDKNIISLLELLNYKRPLRVPARATQVFRVVNLQNSSAEPFQITLPKYTVLLSSDQSSSYLLNSPVSIDSNLTADVEVEIIEGVRHSYSYTGKDITTYKFYLPLGEVTEEDFIFKVDGVEWDKCDNAFLEYKGGRKYSLHRDAYDSHYILLSHNYSEYISETSTIDLEFTTCSGDISVAPHEVSILSGNEYSNYIQTYNKDFFTGGYIDSDILLERAKIQAGCKVLDKLVRLEDYEHYIDNYPGIIDSYCVDCSVRDFQTLKPYEVLVYIITPDNSSSAFKTKLEEDIKSKQVYSNAVIIRDGMKVGLNISIKIVPKSSYVNVKNIEEKIKSIVTNLYSTPKFNKPILREEIYTAVLSEINELHTLDITEPSANLYPNLGEYYTLTDVTVEVGEI